MTTPSLDDLIAHRPPLRLLDSIVEISERTVLAETRVRADNPFFQPGYGLPGYVGLEMMAQAIAAIDGFKCYKHGQKAKIGFLLGSRRYLCREEKLDEGETLRISAEMVFADHAMLAFDCRIDRRGSELATANLKVFAPSDPAAFLKGQTV
jgi:predicted hotdog family 3-hydroxylacyl-ACP dehydratase